MKQHLSNVLKGVEVLNLPRQDPEVTGIQHDSRILKPGEVFIAISGFKHEGHLYIDEAIKRGASAVVVSEPPEEKLDVPTIWTGDTRVALARMAGNFYRNPSEKLNLIGVTGTNGKTTTAWMVYSIILKSGSKCGLIGTIGFFENQERHKMALTTPEAPQLQEMLAGMLNRDIHHVVMEVSSIGLELSRVAYTNFKQAIYTNITDNEHLDFHKTFENYLQAKLALEELVPRDLGPIILNNDDDTIRAFPLHLQERAVFYGLLNGSEITAKDILTDISGSEFIATGPWGEMLVNLPIPGLYNVGNALAAMTSAHFLGIEPAAIKRGLEKLPQIPGRFEKVNLGQHFSVIIDYAHTPDGLANLLSACRDCNPKRLITVFGCGGDRDSAKRPKMGRIAHELSDCIIVTSDNPRTEDPELIIQEILLELQYPDQDILVLPDRREAIRKGITLAEDGDMVVIAGKGHEDYQILGDNVIHFDDREEAANALKELGYGE